MDHKFNLVGSFRNAMRGIVVAVETQRNVRIHLFSTVLVVALGFWLQIAREDWLWLTVAIVAVWVAELFNTAIEQLTDLASPQWHPLARNAKDMAAGAVLVTALGAVIIGIVVLMPYIWSHAVDMNLTQK